LFPPGLWANTRSAPTAFYKILPDVTVDRRGFEPFGLKYGGSLPGGGEAKEKTYALVQEFERRFAERNRTAYCRGLPRADPRCRDKRILSERVPEVWSKAVKDAAEILESSLYLDQPDRHHISKSVKAPSFKITTDL